MGLINCLPKLATINRKLLCLEVNPPKGCDVEAVLHRFAAAPPVDLLNITDSALAKMRMSGLMFAALCKQRLGIEPVVNVACRDRNVIGLQSDLLGAWALGVRSVVALTGDAVTVGDMPDAKGVFEVNSIGLLGLIKTLNEGLDLAGGALKGAPSLVPGVVFNPNVRNPEAEIRRLQKKKDAGAVYGLSQPVFDAEQAASFFKLAAGVGIDLFVGVLPFKSAGTMEGIAKVPGIKIPPQVVERVQVVPDADVPGLSMTMAEEVCAATSPFVRGFHVVSGGTPLLALQLAGRLRGNSQLMGGNEA